MKKQSYAERQAKAKRAQADKRSAIIEASSAVETLWKKCVAPNNTFTENERKAIAHASDSLRGVLGGWVNRGPRR